MTIDIIILSYDKSPNHRKLTENAILSLKQSENIIKFNIIIVETNKNALPYDNVTTLYLPFPFNYNRALNWAIGKCNNEYICMANNDLIFNMNWADILITYMSKYKVLSASPFSRINRVNLNTYNINSGIYKGYNIGLELLGWCIVVNRNIFKKIKKLNEDVEFWYSDNIYADQLKKYNIEHHLHTHSIVDHIGQENTISSMPINFREQMMQKQKIKYDSIDKRTL